MPIQTGPSETQPVSCNALTNHDLWYIFARQKYFPQNRPQMLIWRIFMLGWVRIARENRRLDSNLYL